MEVNLGPESDAKHDPELENASNKDQEESSSKLSDSHVLDDENDDDNDSQFEIIGVSGDGTTSKLCGHCQWMLDNWFLWEENHEFEFPHHEFEFQLEEAALSGCGLCYEFWYKKSYSMGTRTEKPSRIEVDLGEQDGSRHLALQVKNLTKAQYDEEALEKLFDGKSQYRTYNVIMVPAKYSALRTERSENVQEFTKNSMWLADRWLKRCQKCHWKCKNPSRSVLPTRLIYTGLSPARIRLSKYIPASSQYATLSHCWGHSISANLTKDNLASFQERIPPEALSQTIQDALYIAHQLGFSFVWIDKLCIVQDDHQDWERESALMTTVYGNSSLNIAAAGAHDGSIGCFVEREKLWKCQAIVNFGGSSGLYDLVSRGFMFDSLISMPLLERGWALQERLLASRTLHFTRTEIFWECHQNSSCETFPDEIPEEFQNTPFFLKKTPMNLSLWDWTVERYARCKLTYRNDRLVAISGLARHIYNQTKDQYIAGSWRNNLVVQLGWLACEPFRRLEVFSDIAPTWSWASTNEIYLRYLPHHCPESESDWLPRVAILDVIPHDRDADPFGPISMATLRIHCDMLLHVRVIPRLRKEHFIIFGHERLPIYVFWDVEEMEFGADEGREIQSYLLPLVKSSETETTYGIFLHPVQSQTGTFQRTGRFSMEEPDFSTLTGSGTEAEKSLIYPADCWKVSKDREGKTQNIIQLI